MIDDGSQDESLAVCRQFEGRGVEVLTQENVGAHATINRGVSVAAADCDIIAILNSDDQYVRERFEKCLPVLENDPAAAVVVSALRYIDESGEALPEDHPRGKWLRAVWSRWGKPELDLAEWMGQANFVVSSSNVIARREFLLAHPFKPYRYNHDYYFLAQAAIRGALRVVGEPLISYRVHAQNTINTSPAPLMRELLRQHLDLYRDLADELGRDTALRTRFFRYLRATWDNVSALHAGLLQVVLAELLHEQSDERLASLADNLIESSWPEFATYPNKQLINSFAGADPFTSSAGALAEKLAAARAERDEARERASALRELARLRQRLLSSHWAALGRLCGLGGDTDSDAGKTPFEKLENLRDAVKHSRWLRMGGFRL